ncbi:hypothetical protein FZI85_28230 [Mycobacterium sp. CBMA293]|uniref:hypothetical protein n=1 Tax=unclassified Mycolicibacterium TaxID=2636767 RepID=UPI0012DEF121|nr:MULTISPECIES: hypothetical protein [unclassified Mycolicibacterium]MUL45677.1 hypothetical protein [Mycolicibacterium sp. CBMA 360]MUL60348.1 hypothetical protein [Mycolicibacterium sp. CBMA 335]MUL71440.1 hypothetical protein [Mycolicibacterium sp. CBMA 311]MUL73135.1 hypothetical protein [Mycolicibacterium sp. CBMA 311]MUL97056.1 hypothetical protein [Mycolicibacterium sp. CBMA 230]
MSESPAFGAAASPRRPEPDPEPITYGTAVPGLVTVAVSLAAVLAGSVAMVAGYLTFGAVAMIVSLAAATFGAVWLLSGMLLNEHHHSHGRHA